MKITIGIITILILLYIGFRVFKKIKNEIECNCKYHIPVNYGLYYRCKICKRKIKL